MKGLNELLPDDLGGIFEIQLLAIIQFVSYLFDA